MVEEVEETQYCLLLIDLTLDGNKVENGIIVFTQFIREGETVTYETYKLHTDSDGTVRKRLPYGEYNVHAEYTSDETENTSVQYFTYDSSENFFIRTEKETMHLKLYRCENEVLINKNCKYFLHEPYMTPNNYDLYFDYYKIPVNNIIDAPHDLRRRLQRKLPLTKILHLNLETAEEPEYNTVNIVTRLRMEYVSRNADELYYYIKSVWNEDGLESKLYYAYLEYLLEESTDKVLKEDVTVEDLEGLPLDEQIEYYEDLLPITFEEFVEEEELSVDDFKEPISVYVVRVNNEYAPPTLEQLDSYVLNEDNNYEIYTNPYPFKDSETGEEIEYTIIADTNLPCTIQFERVTEVEDKKVLTIL